MLFFELGLVLVLAVSVLACVLFARPKPFGDEETDVLIICAHSDDCVITGSEYVYGAMQRGRSIKIAYLTCSGATENDEQSLVRKAEALAAWSHIGLPRENFTFLGLKQSPLGGLQSYSHDELRAAAEALKALISQLPKQAALIIPASAESHVDHQNVRAISLSAVADCERPDLKVYETPEYNGFLSMIHCPLRTLVTISRFLPLAGRIISPYRGPCSFTTGGPAYVFLDTSKRLALKKELLTYFHSQNPRLLLEFFGYPSFYRRIDPSQTSRKDVPQRGVTLLCYQWDWSALAFVLAMLLLVLVTSFEVGEIMSELLPRTLVWKPYAILPASTAIAFYVLRWVHNKSSLATCAVVCTACLGFLINIALSWR